MNLFSRLDGLWYSDQFGVRGLERYSEHQPGLLQVEDQDHPWGGHWTGGGGDSDSVPHPVLCLPHRLRLVPPPRGPHLQEDELLLHQERPSQQPRGY